MRTSGYIKHIYAFSMLEMLLCITILAILAIFIIKPYAIENIALRQANLHIQRLQYELNQVAYQAFLKKAPINTQSLSTILQNATIVTKFFTFKWQQNRYILQIGKKRLNMQIRNTNTNHYIITCNPAQLLCRQLYHRKHAK